MVSRVTAFTDAVRLFAADLDDPPVLDDTQLLQLAAPFVSDAMEVNVLQVAIEYCQVVRAYHADSAPERSRAMTAKIAELANRLRSNESDFVVAVANVESFDPIDQAAIAQLLADNLDWTVTETATAATGNTYQLAYTFMGGMVNIAGMFVAPAGVHVTAAAVDSNDNLILTFSNGSTLNAGMLPVSTAAGLNATQVQNLITMAGHADQTDLDAHEASTHNTDATARAAAAAASTSAATVASNLELALVGLSINGNVLSARVKAAGLPHPR